MSETTVPITKSLLNDLDGVLSSALRLARPNLGAVAQSIEQMQDMVRRLHDKAIEVERAEQPTPKDVGYDPQVTLSRSITKTTTETLVVHASDLGFEGWALVAQAFALDENFSGDAVTRGAIERVEDSVFFAEKFKDRIVEETRDVQVAEAVTIQIKE